MWGLSRVANSCTEPAPVGWPPYPRGAPSCTSYPRYSREGDRTAHLWDALGTEARYGA
jgi:hypothetical protein